MKVSHEPGYGQFYLQDPDAFDMMATSQFTEDDIDRKYHQGKGIITVFVISQGSPITIDLELLAGPPDQLSTTGWDRIIECPIDIESPVVVLASCPDGPQYGKFAELACPPGSYAARIFYGGQDTFDANGDSKDFYRIELWQSEPFESKELFLGSSMSGRS
jgi:hypothetical protein